MPMNRALFVVAVAALAATAAIAAPQSKNGNGVPRYVVDPFWPKNEHGIHIDKEDNVWLAGNDKDDQILKFTPDGKFLLQIGKADTAGGSNSTTRLGRPAHMVTDDAAGEVYVADGYGNRRIIVFDAKTG